MSRPAPIAAGFRVAAQRPGLVACEIAWRWTFGVAVWMLLVFTFFTYLGSIHVNKADAFLLRSRVPPLMAQAIRDIFAGTGPRLLRAAAVLLPAFGVMWSFAASFGRWATLRALLDDVRGRYRTVLGLHFLRAAVALAAWIGYLGALLIAALVASRGPNDRPGLFLLVFFVIAAVVAIFHGRVRWYLFLANLFAVRDGGDAFGAISAAFAAYRERRGRFWALGLGMGAIRVLVLVGVTVVSVAAAAVIPDTAWVLLLIVMGAITLAYFVVADFLFTVRLAAYLEILRDEPEPEPVAAAPAPPVPMLEPDLPPTAGPQPTVEAPSTVDRGPSTPHLEPSS